MAPPSWAKVKLDAALKVGAETGPDEGQPRHELDLYIKSKRIKGFRAKGKITARYENSGVVTDWLKIDRRLGGGRKIEFGYIKKRMGLEYHLSSKERLTPERSYLYKQLESFGLVGIHHGFRYIAQEDEDDNDNDNDDDKQTDAGYWSWSIGASQSQDATAIAAFITPLTGGYQLGNWSLLQYDHIENQKQWAYANVTSIAASDHEHLKEAEIFLGLNTVASELAKTFGDGEPVHFYAIKTRYGLYDLPFIEEKNLWLMQLSYMIWDQRYPEVYDLALMMGQNIWFEDGVRLSLNGELVAENSSADTKKLVYDQSRMILEFRIDF